MNTARKIRTIQDASEFLDEFGYNYDSVRLQRIVEELKVKKKSKIEKEEIQEKKSFLKSFEDGY